jgi:hypothetical protein
VAAFTSGGPPRKMDADGGQACLVVEDAPEMIAIREDLGLQRQERTARVDEVDAGEAILEGDFLRAQVFLHGDRIVGTTLDRGVVGDDDRLAPMDDADPRRNAGGRSLVAEHAIGGQRRQLEERRVRVDERIDALAGKQLAALVVAPPLVFRSAALRSLAPLA